MAFRKTADAKILKPDINFAGWGDVRRASNNLPFDVRRGTKIVLQEYEPKEFLLSHCTIIASVDTEKSAAPLGKHVVDGFQIERKWADWLITPDTTKYVNNNCFVAGTMILMADGTEKPIEQVIVGDTVVSHTGALRRVTETFVHPFRGNLRVIQRLGDQRHLEVTPEHPFYAMVPATTCACGCGTTFDRRDRKAAKHRFQDYVHGHGARARRNSKPNYGWVSAGLLGKGDFLSTPRLQGEFAATGITPGKARLLGYYLAEGYYHRQKAYRISEGYKVGGPANDSFPVSVDFALNLDETDTLVAEIQSLLRLEFGVGSSVQRVSPGGVSVHSHQSVELVHFFQKYATEYAKSKRVAAEVLQWPLELQREVVRGWIEGDGCVESTAGGWVSVTSASPELVSQMHVVFGRLGVFATRGMTKTCGRKRVRTANGGVQVVNDWSKTCVAHKLQIGSVHAEALLGGSFLEPLFKRSVRGRKKHTLGFRVREDRTTFPVRSVTKKYFDGTVYNFETAVDHSYVANGVAVHNCDAWERKLLLACFRTFIGGDNYVEHIQIPEMSKGKIIDAAARDIGDSIYVDILVATQRRHRSLISAITSGQLQTLSMGCFVSGTPVTMSDGTRLPIEEIVVGDIVLTHKGRPREVLNKQLHYGKWDMRRIEIKGVPDAIEATDTHPFFVLRPAKTCACGCGETLNLKNAAAVRRMSKRFKRGHDKRILNPNGSYSLEEARERKAKLKDITSLKVEKIQAGELAVGDYVIIPKLDTEIENDPGSAKARLLGYFLAEGSFLKSKGVPVEVQFNFSLDEKATFAEETIQLLRESFPGCTPWLQNREDRHTSTVHVYGREIAEWFQVHGGEYSHLKHLSAAVMRWSTESHRHLLGAWINGDGHRSVMGHSVGTTTSYALATQLHLLSIRCGLPVWMDCIFGGKTTTISEAVVGGVSRRHEVTGKLAAFNLYFPQSAAKDLADVTVKAPVEGVRKKERHLRVLDEMVIFPITSIEDFAYEGWVHNMEVDEDHSYQVNGLAAANCQVEHTTCTKCGNVAYDETQLCFPPGTRVLRSDGLYIPIEDVVVGDLLITHKGNARAVSKTMRRYYDGALTTLKVDGVPSTLRSTPEHPYWVLRPARVCACGCGQLLDRTVEHKRGDSKAFLRRFRRGHFTRIHNPNPHVLSLNDYRRGGAAGREVEGADNTEVEFEFVEAAEVHKGDYLAFPIPVGTVSTLDATVEKARLIGFFAAEGSFIKRGGKPVGVEFTFGAHERATLAEEVRTLLDSVFGRTRRPKVLSWKDEIVRLGIKPIRRRSMSRHVPAELTCLSCEAPAEFLRNSRFKSGQDCYKCKVCGRGFVVGACHDVTARIYDHGSACSVRLLDEQAADFFWRHCGEYASAKKLSAEVMNWPSDMQGHVLRCWLGGDGTQNKDGVRGNSASFNLTSQMHVLAARSGLYARRSVVFDGQSAEIQKVVNGDGSVTIRDSRGWLPSFSVTCPEPVGFSGEVRFEDSDKARVTLSRFTDTFKKVGNWLLYRVRDVRSELYSGMVHNVEVDGDHSYVVDGVAVHNCNHIRYFKGNEWVDELGKKRKIAELCGHFNEEPGSVKFIEASWVANPAFTGAVLRNVLSPEELAEIRQVGEKMSIAFAEPPRVGSPDHMLRAARLLGAQGQDQGQGQTSDKPEKTDDPMSKAVDEMADLIREKAIAKARSQMGELENSQLPDENLSNESLIRSALRNPTWRRIAQAIFASSPGSTTSGLRGKFARKMFLGMVVYRHGGWKAIEESRQFTGREILGLSRLIDLATKRRTMAGEPRIYRTVLAVGGLGKDGDVNSYLAACRQIVGRSLTDSERQALLVKGRLYALGS